MSLIIILRSQLNKYIHKNDKYHERIKIYSEDIVEAFSKTDLDQNLFVPTPFESTFICSKN